MSIRKQISHVKYGPGATSEIVSYVQKVGFQKVLLVTGRDSFQESGASEQLHGLTQIADCRRWFDFQANFDTDDLQRGLAVVAEFGPDLVIGVGGGSAMDMAKLLACFDLSDIDKPQALADVLKLDSRPEIRSRSLILVPTTSGSGSESTHFAVVYQGERKLSVAGSALRPDKVFLDPLLAISGSNLQRANSGLDALSQAIESLWASEATDLSRRYARHALTLLSRHLSEFVDRPNTDLARAMCIGSHLAGRAIDISKTTAAHALSYQITKRFGLPHGNAVAISLGWFIDEHGRALEDTFPLNLRINRSLLEKNLNLISRTLGFEVGGGQKWMTQFLEKVGLTSDLRYLATTEEDIIEIVESVNFERLANNPVPFSGDDLKRLFVGEN